MSLVDKYIKLEQRSLELDSDGEYLEADLVRDEMDEVWFSLSKEEREQLRHPRYLVRPA